MEFGRIQHIDKIDFSLPADAVMTEQVLGQAVRDNLVPLRCYVGGTGWGQPNWIGKVYPRGTKPKDFLPGNKMAFRGIDKEEDRQALIAYLKQETGATP